MRKLFASLAAFAVALAFAPSALASPYMQNQPLHSGLCGEFAVSNAINWMTGASTTGRQIYKQFPHYRVPSGASYHTGKRDLIKAAARRYLITAQKFSGHKLHKGFEAAKQTLASGGTVIMYAGSGKLTGSGHFVMGYMYKDGDKIAVSDSNRKHPDRWYSISWLLNTAKGHVTELWVYS